MTATTSTEPSIPHNDPLTIGLLSILGAFAAAFEFVCVMTWSLPPTDLAYGAGPFGDPFVVNVMSFGAMLSGLATAPIAYFLLRRTRLQRAVLVVATAVSLWIAAVTPFSIRLGWLGSYAVLIVALVACHRHRWTRGI